MLSPHFSLQEFLISENAARLGIINTPNEKQLAAMEALCVNVMEPIRVKVNAPVIIVSGFRCSALNIKTPGSSSGSQHMTGEACDFHVVGASPPQVARWLENQQSWLTWDQLILEFPDPLRPHRGWNHISYRAEKARNRQMILTATRSPRGEVVYSRGLPEWIQLEPAWGP